MHTTNSLMGLLVESVVVATLLALIGKRIERRWDVIYLFTTSAAGGMYGALQRPEVIPYPVHSSEISAAFPVWLYLLSFLACGLVVRITERAGGKEALQVITGVLVFFVANVILRFVLFAYGV